jgi:ASC-1-like (ASCH) protein
VKKTPLFLVKKEVFEWIKAGLKTIEIRKGKAKSGDQAVFQCGRNIIRGKIIRKDEDTLQALMQTFDFKQIIPTANDVVEAEVYIKKLYEATDGKFTAYQFTVFR